MAALRTISGVVGAVVLACACSYPFDLLAARVMRVEYALLEALGVMNTSGPLGGQVGGRNYFREPESVHSPVHAVGYFASHLAIIVAGLVLYHRVVFGAWRPRVTLCGQCALPMPGSLRCACGHSPSDESTSLQAGWLPSLLGPARARLAIRLSLALTGSLAVTFLFCFRDRTLWNVRIMLIEMCERLGGQVTYLGALPWPDPFFGEHAGLFNGIAMHGPRIMLVACELGAAITIYHALVRSRRPRYRGPTLCGVCGYHLAGVVGVRCPECGTTGGG